MKYFIIAALIVLSGCSVTQESSTEYMIAPKVSISKFDTKQCSQKSIKVGHVFGSKIFRSKKMKYAQNKYEVLTFNDSSWAKTPSNAISSALVRSIRATGLFFNVSSYQSRSRNDLILETTIEDLMQYFDTQKQESFVKVRLSFNLVEHKTNRVIKSMTFEKIIAVKELSANAGVEALNRALEDVLEENNQWLGKICK